MWIASVQVPEFEEQSSVLNLKVKESIYKPFISVKLHGHQILHILEQVIGRILLIFNSSFLTSN
jgi:hypothetical protein